MSHNTRMAAEATALEQSDAWRRRGRMDAPELEILVAGVCEALQAWHHKGLVHGRVSPRDVRVGDEGKVYLDQPGSDPNAPHFDGASAPLFGVLADGYAAFEQYMDEEAWPLGPWTDIHAVSALAYALITGDAPTDAVKRMAGRAAVRFDPVVRNRFSTKLLTAVERGLSVPAQARQQSLDEFLLSAGFSLRRQLPGEVLGNELGAAKTAKPAESRQGLMPANVAPPFEFEQPELQMPAANDRKRAGWAMPVAVLLLLGAGVALWLAQEDESSRGAVAQPSASVSTEIEPAEPTFPSDPIAFADDAAPTPAESTLSDSAARAASEDAGLSATGSGQQENSATAPASDGVFAQSSFGEPQLGGATLGSSGHQHEELVQAGTDAIKAPQVSVPPESATAANSARAHDSVAVGIHVRPWGEVFIDGASQGISPPLRTLSLPPGSYQVRIQNSDLPPAQMQLTVKSGEPAGIQHSF